MSDKTKVHRVTVLIVDHDDVGADSVRDLMENVRYPNHCLSPNVLLIETGEVDWDDDHPLNYAHKMSGAADRLLGKRVTLPKKEGKS